jgi:hypothetical protein
MMLCHAVRNVVNAPEGLQETYSAYNMPTAFFASFIRNSVSLLLFICLFNSSYESAAEVNLML